MIKAVNKLGIEENYFNIVKTIYERPAANIILSDERLKALPLRLVTSQGCSLSLLLLNIVLEVLARTVNQEKEKKASKLKRKN